MLGGIASQVRYSFHVCTIEGLHRRIFEEYQLLLACLDLYIGSLCQILLART